MRKEKDENVNYKHKEEERQIRQSYHTKFTRFQNASATGELSRFLLFEHRKREEKNVEGKQAAAATIVNVSL